MLNRKKIMEFLSKVKFSRLSALSKSFKAFWKNEDPGKVATEMVSEQVVSYVTRSSDHVGQQQADDEIYDSESMFFSDLAEQPSNIFNMLPPMLIIIYECQEGYVCQYLFVKDLSFVVVTEDFCYVMIQGVENYEEMFPTKEYN